MQSSSVVLPEITSVSECLDRLSSGRGLTRPVSTYRFQFNKDFRFTDAVKLVPYLHQLGVTTCYASPILKARAGSMHGYDIINHNELNPEIGIEAELNELVDALHTHSMSLVLDVVPNHMGVGYGTNPWWQDVLRNGQASKYADFFDIDWDPLKSELHNKVLLPILGDQYGKVLEEGHLKLVFEGGEFRLEYYDKVLPIDPQTYPHIFRSVGEPITTDTMRDFLGLLSALGELPHHDSEDVNLVSRRQRELPPLQQRLVHLIENSPEVREFVNRALERVNGKPGDPRSYDALHNLLEQQTYRLAHWRVSAEEINYRRFFDVNELVGLRMEDPQVFAATQGLIRRLLASGVVSGLRIDHPDGLFNPRQYFTRLQMLYVASQCCGPQPIPPLAENGIELEVQRAYGERALNERVAPLYVVVEKILEPGEELPTEWPVDGTVGYEFANLCTHLFIDANAKKSFTNIYTRFIEEAINVDRLIYQSKKLIMHSSLSSEVNVLSHMLDEISSYDRYARDFTRKALRDAIRETIACFPVYRTYIDERGNITERDRMYIQQAIARAKRVNGSMPSQVFDFLADTLLLRRHSDGEPFVHGYRRQLYFTLKFQQLTGPVMAKGLEDTVCYAYNRFVAANEVGGSPKEFGVTAQEFHESMRKRQEHWPYAMLATSTHDTKRSEDLRMRLAVLSEMPREWATAALRWRRINRGRKLAHSDGRIVPDTNEEYFLYQTLVGAWPLPGASHPTQGVAGEQTAPEASQGFALTREQRKEFLSRIQQYMFKAVHEAKINVSWVNQNAEYSKSLATFVEKLLTPGTPAKPNSFLRQIERFAPAVAYFGVMNSIAATVLKLAAPGVPDVYQGQEMFDFSLVDPDNRRPVDYKLRKEYLDRFAALDEASVPEFCREMLAQWFDGRTKLWAVTRTLHERRNASELFQKGDYSGLAASGEHARHAFAYLRYYHGQAAVVAVPRFAYSLMKGKMQPPIGAAWGDTKLIIGDDLAGRTLRNALTGETVSVAGDGTLLCSEVFRSFPAALLLA